MDTHGETWLIYNGASGSHDDDALRAMVDAMGAAGYAPTKVVDCKDGTPDAADANRGGLGLVAVHGGDGTLSRTIAGLEGFSGRVLPLPGGTFNLLAREIFGERSPLDIIEMLGAGHLAVRRRNCIRGDGVLALCELLAGPGAKWADVREELREANVGEMLVKGWDAATTTHFERASHRPAQTLSLYYDRIEALVARGVLPRRWPHHHDAPEAFPIGFVPDP